MIWTLSEIKRSFSGRLIGKTRMKKAVCETLLYLPDQVIGLITKNVWFISSPEDAWAFTFKGSDIHNQHLIIISDELIKQKTDIITYTILHEIGHVILGHENSMGFNQTKATIKQQETEADLFARRYFPI